MRNHFENYHKQNQIILELLFLPVTLLVKLVKLLVKNKQKRQLHHKRYSPKKKTQARFELPTRQKKVGKFFFQLAHRKPNKSNSEPNAFTPNENTNSANRCLNSAAKTPPAPRIPHQARGAAPCRASYRATVSRSANTKSLFELSFTLFFPQENLIKEHFPFRHK